MSMKSRGIVVGGVLLLAFTTGPADAWQVSPEEHAKHHPAAEAEKAAPTPQATSNAKLDQLVAKMNAAQGQAKVDAMAELLTALVQQHQSMHGNMGQMMSKMKKKHGAAAK